MLHIKLILQREKKNYKNSIIHLIHLPLSPEDLAPSPAPSLGVGLDVFSAAGWMWSYGALLGAKEGAGTGVGIGVGPKW